MNRTDRYRAAIEAVNREVSVLIGHPAAAGTRVPRHRLRLRVTTSRGSMFTVNVGHGGVCTEQMRVFPVGTRVEGHISLDGREAAFSGRVAWTLAGDPRLGQLGRMGMRFDRVGPELAQGLANRADRMEPQAAAC